MPYSDVLLGHVVVERGWVDAAALEACLQADGGLVRQLLQRGLIPPEELELLRAEIAKVLDQDDAQEDLKAARTLRSSGHLTQEHLEAATACASREGLPLRRVLLERGYVTLSALQDALHAPEQPSTDVACRACGARSTIEAFDPDRVYLCKACQGELAPSNAPAVEGEFGPYTSVTKIGEGGMSVVYKAWDDVHRRWVALKVVQDGTPLEGRGTLRREVEIARSLHHPNLVALYGVNRRGSRTVIVMQYVDGRTIAGLDLAPDQAASLIAVVARAVQYAHARGIVHRDIKPANIMIDRDGKPYLVDFGLAKADVPATTRYETSVGTVKGTPCYLAPEQAVGIPSRIDRRTDIYALGAVLYDLLTGRPPHKGLTPMETLKKVVYDPVVPPSELVPDIPPSLEAVVMTCLESDKNRRYPTARHLAEALEGAVKRMRSL